MLGPDIAADLLIACIPLQHKAGLQRLHLFLSHGDEAVAVRDVSLAFAPLHEAHQLQGLFHHPQLLRVSHAQGVDRVACRWVLSTLIQGPCALQLCARLLFLSAGHRQQQRRTAHDRPEGPFHLVVHILFIWCDSSSAGKNGFLKWFSRHPLAVAPPSASDHLPPNVFRSPFVSGGLSLHVFGALFVSRGTSPHVFRALFVSEGHPTAVAASRFSGRCFTPRVGCPLFRDIRFLTPRRLGSPGSDARK